MWYVLFALACFLAGDVVEYKFSPLRRLSYRLDALLHKVIP